MSDPAPAPRSAPRPAPSARMPAHRATTGLSRDSFSAPADPVAPPAAVALIGYLGAGNIGNDASLEVVLDWLGREPGVGKVRIISSHPHVVTRRYGVDAVPMSRCPPAGPSGLTHKIRRVLGRAWDVPRAFALAGRPSAVIVPGMGVFEESLPVGPWGFPLTLALMALACRVRGTPFLLLDIGAEPPTDPRVGKVFEATARLASHLSVRDERSATAVTPWLACRPDVYPDLVFAHRASPQVPVERDLIVVGCMGGGWEDAYRGTRDVRSNYLQVLVECVEQLVADGYQVVLTGGDDADHAVALKLRSTLLSGHCVAADRVSVDFASDFEGLTRLLARAQVVVASRYHNLVGALKMARPTVSIAYAEKCADLMQDCGLGEFNYDIRNLCAAELVNSVRRADERAPEIHQDLLTGNETRARQVDKLLAQVLGGADKAIG